MKITSIMWFIRILLKNEDITDKQIIDTILFLRNLSLESVYFIETSECENTECIGCCDCYYSPLESYLVETNNIGYPIQYTVGVVFEIFKEIINNYTDSFLTVLNRYHELNRNTDLKFKIVNYEVSPVCEIIPTEIKSKETDIKGTAEIRQFLTEILENMTETELLDLLTIYCGE